MSEPTAIRTALARAEILCARLQEITNSVRAVRHVNKVGVLTHLDEDLRQLRQLAQELRLLAGEESAQ